MFRKAFSWRARKGEHIRRNKGELCEPGKDKTSRRCQSRTATGRPKRPVLPLHYILVNIVGIGLMFSRAQHQSRTTLSLTHRMETPTKRLLKDSNLQPIG